MGYRYAYERRAYLALSPKQRLQVKEIMEQIWQDKGGVDALRKYRMPCPSLLKPQREIELLKSAVDMPYAEEDN